MNYNFNMQFPFPWNAGNPYMPSGFAGASNLPMQAALTPATQTHFSLPQPSGQSTQAYNGNLIGPAVRFPSGMYPFGINGTFPANWNFSYNTIQSAADPQSQIQSQASVQGVNVVPPPAAAPVQPLQVTQNIGQMPNPIVGEILGNGQVVTDKTVSSNTGTNGQISDHDFAEKVSSLLADPNILKSALSKLAKPTSKESMGKKSTSNLCFKYKWTGVELLWKWHWYIFGFRIRGYKDSWRKWRCYKQ